MAHPVVEGGQSHLSRQFPVQKVVGDTQTRLDRSDCGELQDAPRASGDRSRTGRRDMFRWQASLVLVDSSLLTSGTSVQPGDMNIREVETPHRGAVRNRGRSMGKHGRCPALSQDSATPQQITAAFVERIPVRGVDVGSAAYTDPHSLLDEARDRNIVIAESLGFTS